MRKLFLTACLLSTFATGALAEEYKIKANLFPKYARVMEQTDNNQFTNLKFKEGFLSYSILQQVNDFVNGKVRYKDDIPGEEIWQTANETLQLGTGDCEDYAILKKQILLNNGYAEDQLTILVGHYRDKKGKAIQHSVLRVQEKTGEYKYLNNEDRWVEDESPLSELYYGINDLGGVRK